MLYKASFSELKSVKKYFYSNLLNTRKYNTYYINVMLLKTIISQ